MGGDDAAGGLAQPAGRKATADSTIAATALGVRTGERARAGEGVRAEAARRTGPLGSIGEDMAYSAVQRAGTFGGSQPLIAVCACRHWYDLPA
ncbi:hypothetical protein Are01nite_27570 [Actinoplanes regularis]|nr:hypothetical protein Are01nite_27570 [Actinoplanes regularis]